MNLRELNVPRLDSFFGAWAIDAQAAESLRETVARLDMRAHMGAFGTPASAGIAVEDGIAIVRLEGVLMKHAPSFGGASYVQARRAIRAAVNDDSVAGIMLVFDSPGGSVAGCHDLAADIRAAAKVKPVHGFGEDLVASAAVWNISQCSRVSVNSTCQFGSIGCFVGVTDSSKAAEMDGIKVHRIATGPLKGAGMPGTEVTDEMVEDLQVRVNEYMEHFASALMEGRGMTRARVSQLATGGCWVGASVPPDLIDAVETYDEAMAALRAAATGSGSVSGLDSSLNANEEDTMAAEAATLKELKAAFPNSTAEFREDQLEQEATLDTAKDNWIAHLELQQEEQAKAAQAAQAKADEAEAAAAEAQAKLEATPDTGGTGVDAQLNSGPANVSEDDDDDEVDAASEFKAKVDAFAKRRSRTAAVSKAMKEYPALYKRYREEANSRADKQAAAVAADEE